MMALDRDPEGGIVPPHNIEAEQAFLAALLIQNSVHEKVAGFLRAEHFYEPAHGMIYDEAAKLIERGQMANPVTLRVRFEKEALLADIGGPKYLARLVASVVTVTNAEDFGRTIFDAWLRRTMLDALRDGMADVVTVDIERPATTVLEGLEARLAEIGERKIDARGPRHVADVVGAAMTRIEAAVKAGGAITGVTTGLKDLDKLLGGLQPTDLILLGGRPGMGKTAMLGTIALAAARKFQEEHQKGEAPRRAVAAFELEMSAEQLTNRLLADMTGISEDAQRRGDLTSKQVDELTQAGLKLSNLPLLIDDTAGLSVAQIRTRARRIQRKRGLGLILVDYLQLMSGPSGGRQQDKRIVIGDIANGLKGLAKELNVPIVLLSQLTRDVEKREDKRPIPSDLRESGDIEAAADEILFLYREEFYHQRAEPQQRAGESAEAFNMRHEAWQDQAAKCANLAQVIVAKNRHGPTTAITVRFDGGKAKFEDLHWGAQP